MEPTLHQTHVKTHEHEDEESSIEILSAPPSTESSMESSQLQSLVSVSTATGEATAAEPCQTESIDNPEPEVDKLSGWLKLSGQGFRKTAKTFWFVYGDDTGKLYYYRHPQDLLPVGEIELRSSSLTYDAANREKPGTFEISSAGKTHSLDASDRTRMFFWLDALQKKRRIHSLRNTTGLQDFLLGKQKKLEAGGLLGAGGSDFPEAEGNVDAQLGSLAGSGEDTVDGAQSTLAHLREELRKSFSNFRASDPCKALSDPAEEAWSLVNERPPSDTALQIADRDLERSLSQTQWHLTLSESVSPSSPTAPVGSSVEDVYDFTSNAAVPPGSVQRRASGPRRPAPPRPPPIKRVPGAALGEMRKSVKTAPSSVSPNTALTTSSLQSLSSSSTSSTTSSASGPMTVQASQAPKGKSNSPAQSAPSSNQVVATSPPAGGRSKFMNALRGFKITKDVSEGKENRQPPAASVKERTYSVGSIFGLGGRQGDSCSNCKTVQEELSIAEEELNAHREIIGLLHKEMDTLKQQFRSRDEYDKAVNSDEKHEILSQRDKHIVELEYCRQGLMDEKVQLLQDLRVNSDRVKELEEQISMYQHTLGVKDEIIVSLTNENHTMQQGNGNLRGPEVTSYSDLNLAEERRELETLRDACRAYEAQNRFLTSEILEQKALRENDEAREKVYIMNVASLEAKYCKTLSQYYFLLTEKEAPVRGGEESQSQDVVNRLLAEALELETAVPNDTTDGIAETDQTQRQKSSGSFISSLGKEYDEYGFLRYNQDEDGVLLSRAQMLARQSAEIGCLLRDADDVTSRKIKWENYMVGLSHSGRELTRSPELKALLRMGVPKEFRHKVWKGCIDIHIKSTRIKLGDKYYTDLQDRAQANRSNPAIKQIELDLLRTLPDNRHFQKIDSQGISKLRRVLLCYSVHNPCIGYCQGINRIAAIALLFLTEEESFWCLVAIIDHLMPTDYFTATLAGAQADQRVLKDLVAEKCPRLHAHLEANQVDLSLFTFNWFLTVFVDNIYTQLFLSIWDVFLYEGSKVLFRYGLAFLKYSEEEILQQPNNLAINRFMRTLGQSLTDVRRINTIAFTDLNPFPMRNVASKRQHHLTQIKAELEELEAIRKDLKSSYASEDAYRDGYTSDGDLDD